MAPARDEDGKLVLLLATRRPARRTSARTTGSSRSGRQPCRWTRSGRSRPPRATSSSRAPSCSRSTRSCRLHRPDRGGRRHPAEGLDRDRAAADAALRRGEGRVRAHLGRRRSSATTARAPSSPRTARSSSRAGRRTSAWRTSASIVTDPLIREPFLRVFVWTFVFATLTVLLSFALGLFLAIALDKPGMRFQRSYRVDPDHPVRDPRLPRRCSSGAACSTTTSASSTGSSTWTSRGSSTRAGRRSR